MFNSHKWKDFSRSMYSISILLSAYWVCFIRDMPDAREIKSCSDRVKNNLKTECCPVGWCYCGGILGLPWQLRGGQWKLSRRGDAFEKLEASRTFQEWTVFTVIIVTKKKTGIFSAVPEPDGDDVSSFQHLAPLSLKVGATVTDHRSSLGNGVMKPIFEQILKYKVLESLWVVQVAKLFYLKHLS